MAANANIGRIFAELGIDTTIGTDLARARGQLSSGLSGLASGAAGALGSVATTIGYVGIAAAGMAATVGGVAVNSFKNFEQSVTNAASVLGLTGEAFQQARANIAAVSQELGQETVYSSTEAADAMYNLASAGYDVANMTADDLTPALSLAAGTQYELAGTTALMSSTLSQFNLGFEQSGRVADVYALAIGKSQANMDKLAVSMNYAGPAMQGVNGSLEETTALLSIFYNNGLSAEIAGTGVRTMIASLLDPTSSAAAALAELGLTTEQVNPELYSMNDIISLLGSQGMTMAQSIAIFGREGANAALIASQNSDALRQLTTDLQSAGGAAEQMATQQMDTLAGSLENLKGTYENVLINVGKAKAPALRELFATLTEAAPQVEAALLAIMGFVGDLMSKLAPAAGLIQQIGQTIITSFQNIIDQIGGGGLAAGIANFVTRTLDAVRIIIDAAAPYVQAAVVGIVTFIRSLVSQLGPAWNNLKTIGAGIKTIFSSIFSGLAGGLGGGSGLASGLAGVINTVTAFVARLVSILAQISTQAVPVIRSGINAIRTGLSRLGTMLRPIIARIGAVWDQLPAVFEKVAPILQAAWARIKGVFDQAPGIFSGLVERLRPVWTRIQALWDQLPALFERIRPALETAWGWLTGIFNNLRQIFEDFVSNLGPTWTNLQSIWDSLVTIFQTAWTTLQPLINEIKTQWAAFFDSISGTDAGKASGVGGMLAGVLNTISGAIAYLLEWVAQHPQITTFATKFVTSAGWILAALPPVISAIWDFATAVADWLGRAVSWVSEQVGVWRERWNEYGPAITAAVDGIITTLSGWYNSIKDWLGRAVQYVQDQYTTWSERWNSFKTTIDTYLNPIITTLSGWYNSIVTWLGGAVQYVQEKYTTWSERWASFKTAVDNAVGPIITTLSGWKKDIETYLGGAVGIVTSILNGDWTTAWNGFETAVSTAKDNILKKVGEWKTDLETKFAEVKKAVSDFLSDWGGLWGGVESETGGEGSGGEGSGGGLLSKVWNGLKTAFETLKTELGKKYEAIKEAAGTFITELGTVLGGLSTAIDGVKTAVGLAIGGVLTEITTDLDNIALAVTTFINTTWTTAWTLITQIIDTANINIGLAINAINTTVTTVLDLIIVTLQTFNTNWGTAWAGVVLETTTAAGNVYTALEEIRNSVLIQTGLILSDMDSFRSEFALVWAGIVGDIQTVAGQIAAAITEMANQAGTAMDNFVSAIRTGLDQGLSEIRTHESEYRSAGKALANAFNEGLDGGMKKSNTIVSKGVNTLSNKLPHSPAKEGPFRKLPNWRPVIIAPLMAAIKQIKNAAPALQSQLSFIRDLLPGGTNTGLTNLAGNLEGFKNALHKVLDTPKTDSSTGGVWSKTSTQNGTTTTQSGNITQAQAQELLAKMQKLISVQAPQITIKDVKLDKEYNFNKLVSDIEKYQTAQRRQRGAYI